MSGFGGCGSPSASSTSMGLKLSTWVSGSNKSSSASSGRTKFVGTSNFNKKTKRFFLVIWKFY